MFSVHSSTLETVFEKFLFSGKNLSRFLYGRANRKNKVAYRNLCGLVWTGPWYKFVVFKSALFFPGFAKSFLHSYSIFFIVVFVFLLSHDRQLRSDLFDGGECLWARGGENVIRFQSSNKWFDPDNCPKRPLVRSWCNETENCHFPRVPYWYYSGNLTFSMVV